MGPTRYAGTTSSRIRRRAGTFDLVHARLVLVHVPDRAPALATMAAALRPGGWLLVEDADTELQPLVCLDESGPAQRRANRLRRRLPGADDTPRRRSALRPYAAEDVA